jgi:hypothetical protein
MIQKSLGDHLRGLDLPARPQSDPVILDNGWLASGPSIIFIIIHVKWRIIFLYAN